MFWFKNIMIYRLNREITLSAEEMEKQLAGAAYTPCSSQDMAKSGWVSPLGDKSLALTHAINDQILICVRKEEKILPSSVIKQELQGKIEKLEKDALKDEFLFSLMPRAFSRFSQTFIWLDTARNLVIVDAASAKKAEDALA